MLFEWFIIRPVAFYIWAPSDLKDAKCTRQICNGLSYLLCSPFACMKDAFFDHCLCFSPLQAFPCGKPQRWHLPRRILQSNHGLWAASSVLADWKHHCLLRLPLFTRGHQAGSGESVFPRGVAEFLATTWKYLSISLPPHSLSKNAQPLLFSNGMRAHIACGCTCCGSHDLQQLTWPKFWPKQLQGQQPPLCTVRLHFFTTLGALRLTVYSVIKWTPSWSFNDAVLFHAFTGICVAQLGNFYRSSFGGPSSVMNSLFPARIRGRSVSLLFMIGLTWGIAPALSFV